MILPASAGNLQCAEVVAEHRAALERPAALEAEQERASKRIAAACGVDDFVRLDRRHQRSNAGLPKLAALGTQRDDDALEVRARAIRPRAR